MENKSYLSIEKGIRKWDKINESSFINVLSSTYKSKKLSNSRVA